MADEGQLSTVVDLRRHSSSTPDSFRSTMALTVFDAGGSITDDAQHRSLPSQRCGPKFIITGHTRFLRARDGHLV